MSTGTPVTGQRAGAVLSRFPRYLEAEDPGKRLGAVVAALATGIDVLTRQVQDVRTSHRVDEAPTTQDLLGLAALHGLTAARLAVLDRRVAVLAQAAHDDPLDPAALADQLGVPVQRLADLLPDRSADLADALARALTHRSLMTRRRTTIRGAVGAHAGNATATGLLTAAAAYAGLVLETIHHTEEGWWHLATCHDSAVVVLPPADVGSPAPNLSPVPEVVALEENPFRHADIEPAPKRHGQRTRILRGGLEDVDVGVRVVGVGARTVRPMVVDLATGTGLVFEGEVPDGVELLFAATGRTTLDGVDVTGSAWSFHGGVFADEDQALAALDMVFTEPDGTVPAQTGTTTGPAATFATAAPVASAFDTPSGLPHGAAAVGPLRLPRGESRWCVLVRTARTAGVGGPAVPRPFAGLFDQSVFASAGEAVEPSLQLGFAWEEREPFAVRVLLPIRLATADDDAGSLVLEPLRRLLDRHRAAGVDLRVEYADPRWLLGEGIVRTTEDDALGVVLSGTQLWPDADPETP